MASGERVVMSEELVSMPNAQCRMPKPRNLGKSFEEHDTGRAYEES
jgi:hypothetical protein